MDDFCAPCSVAIRWPSVGLGRRCHGRRVTRSRGEVGFVPAPFGREDPGFVSNVFMACHGSAIGTVGVGIDLVDVERMAGVLSRCPRLAGRLFTPEESAHCLSAQAASLRSQRFAARFAAKEATMTALGVGIGEIGLHEVEIAHGESGEPALNVMGRAASLASGRGGQRLLVSLSHTATVAGAIVLLLT